MRMCVRRSSDEASVCARVGSCGPHTARTCTMRRRCAKTQRHCMECSFIVREYAHAHKTGTICASARARRVWPPKPGACSPLARRLFTHMESDFRMRACVRRGDSRAGIAAMVNVVKYTTQTALGHHTNNAYALNTILICIRHKYAYKKCLQGAAVARSRRSFCVYCWRAACPRPYACLSVCAYAAG